ncbi:3-oxoacyl-ACP synthase [Jejudonia soesokkakensis]|uniref:3-oxoacyl-ACP synthase n=1 Tax=Jejudonia soesokkakensis TaxID=1323432 RepID=A0ABW2MQQ7_9FLAO
MTVKEIKQHLLDHCKSTVEKRYQKITQTISDIQESLLEEDKSSAGDKHETGRAMLQIDRENAGKQLQEIENIQKVLPKIDVNATSDYARLGSLVYTDHATYFISISVGDVLVGKTHYLCVALHSPIGSFLSGKKKGDEFTFNAKMYKVTSVK